jgi:hypothetical protein
MERSSIGRNGPALETERISAAEPRGASQIRVLRISEPKYLPPAVSSRSSNTSCSIALAESMPGAAFSGRAAKGRPRTAPFTPTVARHYRC